jgi:hypothetical protein
MCFVLIYSAEGVSSSFPFPNSFMNSSPVIVSLSQKVFCDFSMLFFIRFKDFGGTVMAFFDDTQDFPIHFRRRSGELLKEESALRYGLITVSIAIMSNSSLIPSRVTIALASFRRLLDVIGCTRCNNIEEHFFRRTSRRKASRCDPVLHLSSSTPFLFLNLHSCIPTLRVLGMIVIL